jgi:hypothetical protein
MMFYSELPIFVFHIATLERDWKPTAGSAKYCWFGFSPGSFKHSFHMCKHLRTCTQTGRPACCRTIRDFFRKPAPKLSARTAVSPPPHRASPPIQTPSSTCSIRPGCKQLPDSLAVGSSCWGFYRLDNPIKSFLDLMSARSSAVEMSPF